MTDLTWLCGAEDEMRPCIGMRLSATDALFWTESPGPCVRLSAGPNDRLLINGVDEEREDFYALMGAIEELDSMTDGDLYRAMLLSGPDALAPEPGPSYNR